MRTPETRIRIPDCEKPEVREGRRSKGKDRKKDKAEKEGATNNRDF
ncbi:hypothetical protein GCM10007362_42700 [Saccharibacillus endophyticus]|uniref:Uncharacterized protein n=1 Tax=Saccharibacillus endophyticus TaxID=2060666 RepID=A0ABQ2A5M7_9BACL|nr:hypothetical protein GCM10007362_42700 [Saccharibacillus endophyticus]